MMTMTAEIASALAGEAADRSMRTAGRSRWNSKDRQAMLNVIDRLAPYVPGWTAANPLVCAPVSDKS